jgi:uncharacterized membrane protein
LIKFFNTALLWFSAIGCGVMGGVYFAFSAFITRSLGRIDQSAGIVAFNAINEDVLKSVFMPIFMGTTLAAAALAVIAFFRWADPGSLLIVAGGIVYVIGMFVVTMAFNVPLNNTLAVADPSGGETTSLWANFLREWTFWNHVRMVASLIACGLFVKAIAVA